MVVAATDLLGIMALSMGPMLEKRLGLQVLRLLLELPAVPIYMIWLAARATTRLRELIDAVLNSHAARQLG